MASKAFGNILIVYKPAPRASRRIPAHAAQEHVRTLDHLYQLLQHRSLPFRAIPLEQLGPIADVDLVITVGGDGTVLATSHFATTQPILGVKSFGQTSVGHFCAATRTTLDRYLQRILKRTLQPKQLHRLRATMNEHPLEELILNECLFAHGSPAAISDYRLCIGRHRETQRSSGVWVGTAAGSTAAMLGAGGRALPLESDAIQYLVREPYHPNGSYRLRGDVLSPRQQLRLLSLTPHGTISIDGAHIQYPAPEGTEITIRNADRPLHIYWR
ncbi:MAG: NAD(+)/NADH kinase [Deltaproteobacteria bacterium]|nr:NAD(+)/NADH kinase [Deltaproteobacteria bacterium]